MSKSLKTKLWIISIFIIPIAILIISFSLGTSIPISISKYISWKTQDCSMNVNSNSTEILRNTLNVEENSDYCKNLNDESLADFRPLIGLNNIYRSYSLKDSSRNETINHLIKKNNIKTIIDGDTETIINIFKTIETKEGPFLISGNDIGIKCSIVETLKTPGFRYIENDYYQSFYNIFPKQLQKDETLIEIIKDSFKNELAKTLNLDSHNVQYLNLNKYAKKYLIENGLTEDEINLIVRKLNAR